MLACCWVIIMEIDPTLGIKRNPHQHNEAPDVGRGDRRNNRVAVLTTTRLPTQRLMQYMRQDENVTVLKMIALPIAHVVALVGYVVPMIK